LHGCTVLIPNSILTLDILKEKSIYFLKCDVLQLIDINIITLKVEMPRSEEMLGIIIIITIIIIAIPVATPSKT